MYIAIAQKEVTPTHVGKPETKRLEKLFETQKEAILWLVDIKMEWVDNNVSDIKMFKKIKDHSIQMYYDDNYMYGFRCEIHQEDDPISKNLYHWFDEDKRYDI